MRKRTIATIALAIAVGGCDLATNHHSPTPKPAAPAPAQAKHAPDSNPSIQQARADLASLPVRAELTDKQAGKYEHTQWDREGKCNTRALLLAEESQTPVRHKKGTCTVVAGTWTDAYSGRQVNSSKGVQIDHMVPEKEAWVSGANEWSPKLWQRFTNDREHGELVVAGSRLNGQKSDSSPDEWMVPKDHAGQCAYTAQYLRVAAHWNSEAQAEGHDLSIDPKQKAAHQTQLDHC